MKIKIRKKHDPLEDLKTENDIAPVGYPANREFLNSIWGNITKHGIKVMADGRQWVINCLNGDAIERKDAKPIKDSRGNILWIGTNDKISILDQPRAYQWENPKNLTI